MSLLTVISPAKTLDYEAQLPSHSYTLPDFLECSSELIAILKNYSPSELSQLMKISDKLAGQNVARFDSWKKEVSFEDARQAMFAFQGDVYQGLDAKSLTENDFMFAQQHLRILSGLYGILRPLDLMRPYRLEMGTKLPNRLGNNLYDFWKSTLTPSLNSYLKQNNMSHVINLASDEYFKAINPKELIVPVIKPVFLDEKNGKVKVISFYAKKARGLMSRFIIQNRITQINDLKDFNLEGYQFNEMSSSHFEWVFQRAEV